MVGNNAVATDLCNQNITVKIAVDLGAALHTNKAVLLAVVQPVPSAASSDQALQLICLHPDQLIDTLVPP